MLFAVIRAVTILETHLVEAPDAATAQANADSGRLYNVERLKPGAQATPTVKQMEDDPSEGEEFEVQVAERHFSRHLIRAKNPKEAIEKVREGEGFCLHETEYVETLDASDWNVHNSEGKWVA